MPRSLLVKDVLAMAGERDRWKCRAEEAELDHHERRCHICGKIKEGGSRERVEYIMAFHYDRRHQNWTHE